MRKTAILKTSVRFIEGMPGGPDPLAVMQEHLDDLKVCRDKVIAKIELSIKRYEERHGVVTFDHTYHYSFEERDNHDTYLRLRVIFSVKKRLVLLHGKPKSTQPEPHGLYAHDGDNEYNIYVMHDKLVMARMMVEVFDDCLCITDVFVERGARRRGYATAMLDFLSSFAQLRHQPVQRLMVYQDNRPARNLYVKLGFEYVENTDRWAAPGDAIYMVRDVSTQSVQPKLTFSEA